MNGSTNMAPTNLEEGYVLYVHAMHETSVDDWKQNISFKERRFT